MKIVLQKVKEAQVSVGGQSVGKIQTGFVLLLAVKDTDTRAEANKLIEKVLKLRLFSDPGSNSFMEKNIQEVQGSVLIVSQFTLYGDIRKGTRPSFTEAARPEQANELYEYFVFELKKSELQVETGKFGEHMEVELVNDGPITLILEAENSAV